MQSVFCISNLYSKWQNIFRAVKTIELSPHAAFV